VLLLIILRQDHWFWEDGTMVFGFMPMGLFYQACISIAASITWLIATQIAWPENLEAKVLEVAGDGCDDEQAMERGAAR
jgi:hypothetical protein